MMRFNLACPKLFVELLKIYKSADTVTIHFSDDNTIRINSMLVWSICCLECELSTGTIIAPLPEQKQPAVLLGVERKTISMHFNVAETCTALDQSVKTKADRFELIADSTNAVLHLNAYNQHEQMINATTVKAIELSHQLDSVVQSSVDVPQDMSYLGTNRFDITFRNKMTVAIDRMLQCVSTPSKATLVIQVADVDDNVVVKFGTNSTLASSMQCVPLSESQSTQIQYRDYMETFGVACAKLLTATCTYVKSVDDASDRKKKKSQRGNKRGLEETLNHISSGRFSKRARQQEEVGLDDDESDVEVSETAGAGDHTSSSACVHVDPNEPEPPKVVGVLFDSALPLCIHYEGIGVRLTLFAGSKQRDRDDDVEDE
jgi:hypothetical protein